MGRKLHYRLGGFYRISDRTGFAVRAEHTRGQWNGIITELETWEPRQPQDLVKGRADNQTVPYPRSNSPATFVGPIYLTVADALAPKAFYITLDSVAGVSLNDEIGVMMDNGVVWEAVVVGMPTLSEPTTLLIFPPVPNSAAAGNLVVDYRRTGTPWGHYLIVNGEVWVTEDGTAIIVEP